MQARWKKIAMVITAAVLLGTSQGAASAQDHSHSHDKAEAAQLTFNNGKKWSTDDNLRQSMSRIRDVLAAELPAIHSGKTTAEQYQTLAQKIHDQITFMAKNCKLDQQTDAMLHLVLADIIAGTDTLLAQGDGAREGAEQIAHALDNYGAYFDHPGWRGIKSDH